MGRILATVHSRCRGTTVTDNRQRPPRTRSNTSRFTEQPVHRPRSAMTISTDSYTAADGKARQATERSVEAWKNGAKTFTDQFDAVKRPALDLTGPVARYFEYVQKVVDVNRDLAIMWAELFSSLSGSVREQAQQVSSIVKDQTEIVADLTVRQAENAEQAAKEQADKAEQAKREQAEEAEEAQQQAEEAKAAEKAKAREARRIEREEAKKAQEKAREAYEGLSKAELSDQLAERGLPKTGNIEDLIERLVSADSE